jgi:hypothetical protein
MSKAALYKKFRIKAGDQLLLVNAPENYADALGPLPDGVQLHQELEDPQQVHWFVKTKKEVDNQVKKISKIINNGALLWVYFPKGSSKMQIDLTRDKGWDALNALGLQMLSLVSLDAIWSAFAMKKRSEEKEITAKENFHVEEYLDKEKRIVKLPADLAELLKYHVNLKEKFEALSFTSRKEFVIWILTAKKEETRRSRIHQLIDKLSRL